MAYKSLLVHVEDGVPSQARLALAVDLARRFDSRLIGIGAEIFYPGLRAPGGPIDVETARRLLEFAQQRLEAAEARFKAATDGLPTLWRSGLERSASFIADEARGADLIIAGRHGVLGEDGSAADPGELIMTSGLPVLVAPPATDSLAVRRVLVGWKNTPQARSAITAALPLLTLADRVEVASVHVGDHSQAMDEMADVVERLKLHGVKAFCQAYGMSDASAAQELLRRAHDGQADVIVVGAYAHARLREWVFGGVTHELLMRADIPVLFAR